MTDELKLRIIFRILQEVDKMDYGDLSADYYRGAVDAVHAVLEMKEA